MKHDRACNIALGARASLCPKEEKILKYAGSCVLTAALLIWAGCAVSENSAAPVPDESLLIYAKPQKLVAIEHGRRIHLFCLGAGSPTVILTAGLGDWVSTWSKVHAPIAQKTRTCAWDRAGFGYSDPSSAPQDASHTAKDLEDALKAARIRGPYVLVGHSAGSYESLLFADKHPRQTRGMVLVDPSFPDQDRYLSKVAPRFSAMSATYLAKQVANAKTCADELRTGVLTVDSPDPDKCLDSPPTYPAALKQSLLKLEIVPARYLTEGSLVERFPASSQLVVNKTRSYVFPIIILTAAIHDAPPDAAADVVAEIPNIGVEWQRAHDAMAALSADGVNKIVAGSRHYIQIDNPETVLVAVNAVIDKARENTR